MKALCWHENHADMLSSHLVDIFAVATQDPPPPPNAIFSGQDTRLLRYQEVLAKLSAADSSKRKDSSSQLLPNGSDGWVSGDENDDANAIKPKTDDIGPLIGGFADSKSTTK